MMWSTLLKSFIVQLYFMASILLEVNSFCHSSNYSPSQRHSQRCDKYAPLSFLPEHISTLSVNKENWRSHEYRIIMSSSIGDNGSNDDTGDSDEEGSIDPNSLMDMDIVIYRIKDDPTPQKTYIGAIQEDMTLAPLSAWTKEPAFGNSIEFVVDEEDRWMKELEFDNVIIERLLSEDLFSYGSRQVGGGKGLGNPHGEESELVYYIENEVLEAKGVEIPIKPELEIMW